MPFPESIKKDVRKRSNFSCCLCRKIGVEIHHIIPEHEGGPDTIENAVPLCPTCHDTYGENPQKRKMLKETRDVWYELCESKLPVNNIILSEISSNILEIKRNMHELKSMAVPILDRMSTKNEWDKKHFSPMSLSNIISILLSFPKKLNVSNEASVKVVYMLLFKTQGDLQNEKDKEYNEEKDTFVKIFGVHVARSLSYYYVYKNQIDWLKGVNGDQINNIIGENFVNMMCLLRHKEIGLYSEEISTFIDNSFEFSFKLESEIDISNYK